MSVGKIDLRSEIPADQNAFARQPESIFDTDHAVYMLNPEGYVLNWNSSAQRAKQYKAEEIIGRHFRTFFTEEDRREGKPEAALQLAREKGKHEMTGWRVRKDGSRFMANVVIESVYNELEELIGFIKIVHDITVRQKIFETMRESAMLKVLVNTAVDGVTMIDAQGFILMFNPACERLFGYQAGEVLGQNVKMLMPAPYQQNHDSYIENYHRTGHRKIIGIGREVVGQRKDGTTFPMELSIGEAKQDGQVMFVGIVHDLTERKRTEAQLAQAQKMETVGQLSGGIAHDFNNLLTVIIGNVDLLIEKVEDTPELKQLCETVLNAGERGAELTQRLLAFSRRQTLQPTVIDCNQLVEQMQVMLRRTLSEDIDIRFTVDSNLAKAFADPSQLESAILNLSLNARDAMPQGGHLTITVNNASLEKTSYQVPPDIKPGDYVMISVTDDGEGMAPEIREHVFEPFFTTKEVGKGTGLGLSMVYGFVRQSNGYVAIYSEIGLGTTVRIYLPAAISAQTVERSPRPAIDLAALRGSETILLVEDDPFVRSHGVSSLESLGYHVITAANGREALVKLHQNPSIHILFSDVVMPGGLNGRELAEQAQKHKPTLKILLTSGYPMETLAERNLHNPKMPVLNKPYRKIDLGRRIREVLDLPAVDYFGAEVPVAPAAHASSI